MKQRCLNPNSQRWDDYGGRGITICKRWLDSFENFYTDMGERPKQLSLDRINNDGNYEPSNCRWATAKQQMNNRSNTTGLSNDSFIGVRVPLKLKMAVERKAKKKGFEFSEFLRILFLKAIGK